MSLVPTQKTPLSLKAYADAVIRNWGATGETTPPSESALAVLYGQYAVETGGVNTWNWNVGNHKWNGSGDYMALTGVWELVSQAEADRLVSSGQAHLDTNPDHVNSAQRAGKVSVVFNPPHPATRFQAFGSLDEGMRFHLASVRKKYGRAWEALLAGQPGEFVRALKAQGYFSGNVDDYEAGVRRGYAQFLASGAYRQAGGSIVPSTPSSNPFAGTPAPWTLLLVTAGLAGGAYVLTRKGYRLPGLSRLRFT